MLTLHLSYVFLHVILMCDCVTVSGRGGQLRLTTLAQSSITHNFLSALVLHPLLGPAHTHTQTHSPFLDAYLTASNSLRSLQRAETMRWLCLKGFLPRHDLCKDTAESAGPHPLSVATPLSTTVIHLQGFRLAPSCGKSRHSCLCPVCAIKPEKYI